MSDSPTCGSCGASFATGQKFCGNCGQPVPTHRIDWHFLSHEVQHGILHVDKGILFTIKHLLTRPGAFIREYIDGNRAGHFKPVLLVMILGAVAALVSRLLGMDTATGSFLSGMHEVLTDNNMGSVGPDARNIHVMRQIAGWIGGHIPLVIVLFIPVFALAMRIAFHTRRSVKMNYPEWLVVSCFYAAQALCIYIIFALIGQISARLGELDLLAMLGFQVWTVLRIFRDKPWWNTALRFIVGYLLYAAMWAAILVLVGVVAMLVANGPDAFMEHLGNT